MVHMIELRMHELFCIVNHLLSALGDSKDKIHVLALLSCEASDASLTVYHR